MGNAECVVQNARRRLSSYGKPPPPHAYPPARDLILRVWHVDPLRCPVCKNPMRVIAAIDDPRVVARILRHLGIWHDPPPSPPRPAGLLGCRRRRGFRGPYRQLEMSQAEAHYL